MKKLTLLICYGDQVHIRVCIETCLYKNGKASPIPDGVFVYGRNVCFLDRTENHDLYVKVCHYLQSESIPYATVELEAKDLVFVGKLPEKDETIRKKLMEH